MKYVACFVTFLLAACSGGSKQCKLDDPSSCPSGEVCESIQNQNAPACFSPVQLQGHVSDLSSAAPIAGATVSALDESGAPAALVAISASDGSYTLQIPSVRADGTGKPLGRKVALRAAAKNYFNFPSGVRISLPIDTSAAVQANASSPYVISGGQSDVGLIALPSAAQGRPSISGTVEVSPSQVGVLVVAETTSVPITAIADRNGAFTLFNVTPGSVHVQAYSRGTNYTAVDPTVQAGVDTTGLQIHKSNVATATLNGSVNLVAGAPGPTSVVVIVESTFNPILVRGEEPPGLRAPDPGIAPNVTNAWSITGVPDGRYVVLAAFENDGDVLDPDPNIAGTQIQHIAVSGGAVVNGVQPSFKVTSAVSMVSPGPGDAMDLAPSQPTFTWQAYPSAHTYDLALFDAMGTVVWSKIGLIAINGQNTATYDGSTPLGSGKVYQWRSLARGNAGNPISHTEELRGIFRIQ
jgi:hypothetical protein